MSLIRVANKHLPGGDEFLKFYETRVAEFLDRRVAFISVMAMLLRKHVSQALHVPVPFNKPLGSRGVTLPCCLFHIESFSIRTLLSFES